MNFIARWLATAVAVAAAAWIVPGIDIVGGDNAWIIIAVFALVLSLVNIGLKPIPRPATSGQLPPYVLKPVSYDDVQMVVRRVRTNQPVVLVFKNTNIETAKRILDFCLGLSCGIGGQVDELGDRVFVITPQGIELSDSDINKLVQDGTIER